MTDQAVSRETPTLTLTRETPRLMVKSDGQRVYLWVLRDEALGRTADGTPTAYVVRQLRLAPDTQLTDRFTQPVRAIWSEPQGEGSSWPEPTISMWASDLVVLLEMFGAITPPKPPKPPKKRRKP